MENRFENQHLELKGRSDLSLNDCVEILNFNDQDVLLATKSGLLHIGGTELKITSLNLDAGQISLKGTIYILSYSDDEMEAGSRGGFFSRLFK